MRLCQCCKLLDILPPRGEGRHDRWVQASSWHPGERSWADCCSPRDLVLTCATVTSNSVAAMSTRIIRHVTGRRECPRVRFRVRYRDGDAAMLSLLRSTNEKSGAAETASRNRIHATSVWSCHGRGGGLLADSRRRKFAMRRECRARLG